MLLLGSLLLLLCNRYREIPRCFLKKSMLRQKFYSYRELFGTLIGVLNHFIVNTGFFSVRLLLSLVFINLTPSPVGMHLVARAAYRNGAILIQKMMFSTHASILLSSNEQNSTGSITIYVLKTRRASRKWYQND